MEARPKQQKKGANTFITGASLNGTRLRKHSEGMVRHIVTANTPPTVCGRSAEAQKVSDEQNKQYTSVSQVILACRSRRGPPRLGLRLSQLHGGPGWPSFTAAPSRLCASPTAAQLRA